MWSHYKSVSTAPFHSSWTGVTTAHANSTCNRLNFLLCQNIYTGHDYVIGLDNKYWSRALPVFFFKFVYGLFLLVAWTWTREVGIIDWRWNPTGGEKASAPRLDVCGKRKPSTISCNSKSALLVPTYPPPFFWPFSPGSYACSTQLPLSYFDWTKRNVAGTSWDFQISCLWSLFQPIMCSLLSSGGREVNKWGHLCLSDKSGLFVQNVRFSATTELLVFPNKMPPICHQVTSNLPPRWHQVATKLLSSCH